MKRIFRVHHMQRAGGHALVAWIISMLQPESTLHVNDAITTLLTSPPPTPQSLAPYDNLLLSIEDASVPYANTILDATWAILKLDPVPTTHILLVRHPYNLFASRAAFQQNCILGNTSDDAINLCAQHYKIHTRKSHTDIPSITTVLFDLLIIDPDYRTIIAQSLKLVPQPWPDWDETTKQTSPSTHQLSSFENRQVLSRRKHLPDSLKDKIDHAITELLNQEI